jgi:predicted NAD/FAD-binding protein
MRENIAVIGSGIAGLASAWLLSRRHDVTLIERNDYVGGHTHTVEVSADGRTVPVDTGFIVYNVANYPLLTRLLGHLGVPTREGDMSFAASIGGGRVEYSGDSLATIFAQRGNLFRPRFLRMLIDILRFNGRCKRLLAAGGFDGLSLGELLERERLGPGFRDDYLLPMAAAIWSCPTHAMMAFPAESLARFFHNHGLLDVIDRPLWRSVVGGSRTYVERMLDDIGRERLVMDGALRVQRRDDGTRVQLRSGEARDFDKVVMACHADEALRLIERPTESEYRLLARFRYQPNQTWLHTDIGLMPRNRRVWSSWNYLSGEGSDGERAVSVTYWMNRLQGLSTTRPLLVSLNPLREPEPQTVLASMTYDHPVFDRAAMAAQPELHRIQGRDRIWFCGSYFGYGFHEDALRAAVDVATRLGADTQWLTGGPSPVDASALSPALDAAA